MRDDPARVEQVVLPQPRRGDAVGGLLVLHEDSAAARDAVEVADQPVAEPKRAGQVVQRVEHQPVSEPVDALVVDERARGALRLVADRARDRGDFVLRHIGQLPLQKAVVVAGRADRVPLGERFADVAVMVLERGCADRVRDPVAVGLDGVLGELLREQRQRGLGAFAERDVAECLPAAVGVETALEPLGVRLERLDRRHACRRLAGFSAGDEGGDVSNLLVAQVALERRHRAASALHLGDDLVEGRIRVVEVRPDGSARPGGVQRVAAAAPGVGEDLRAGLARLGAGVAVPAAPREEPDAGNCG